MPYQMQCALCGVIWHRELGEIAPPPDPPHNHLPADWDAYIAAHPEVSTTSTPPFWDKVTGQSYPPLPDWPPELGAPPPNYPPAGAVTASQAKDFKHVGSATSRVVLPPAPPKRP